MIVRTTLKAGQSNRMNRTGRYFYLLVAADKLRVTFDSDESGFKTLNTEMREGMSSVFDIKVESITLESDTDQYIEFWLSDTKLDYSKLAAGGASATIDSGRAICELGSSLAIPADFRRKSINIQALTDVTIGGIGVTDGTGYAMKAGETLKLGSRGDVYAYLPPAKLNEVQSDNTLTLIPSPANGGGNTTYDTLKFFMCDDATQNLIAAEGRVQYSTDGGLNWQDSASNIPADTSEKFYPLGKTPSAVYFVKGYSGRIGASFDGGVTVTHVTSVQGGKLADGSVINDCTLSYGGWVSGDGSHFLIMGPNYIYESLNSGETWSKIPMPNGIAGAASNAVINHKGVVYLARRSEIYKFDGSAWTQKLMEGLGNDCQLFAAAGKMYFYVRPTTGVYKLYYSEDGWDTYQQTDVSNYAAKKAVQFGNSLILGGKDRLGYIKEFGGEIVDVIPTTPAGMNYADVVAVTNSSVIVKQTSGGQVLTADTKALVYPMTFVDGAKYPAPLQWLAELN